MNRKKTDEIVRIGIFSAIIIVLQIIASFIRFGSFPITLTLIPIIIAGAMYGIKTASILGLSFGIIVVIMVMVGVDTSGVIMMSINPIATISACITKGVLTGFVSSLIYKILKNKKIGLILASISAPIVNTGIFCIFLSLFFNSNLFNSLYLSFISINFLIELTINTLLAPGLFVLIKKKNNFSK